ncbi:MAG: hypothetical protein WC554_11915 [Clostridia bacterium]
MALCEKFGNSGQSGGSAPYTATALSQAIKKLCLQEPICPMTGIDEEWNDVANIGDGSILFQNRRCGPLFKNSDGRAWYLDAVVWKTEDGHTWSGSAIDKNGNKIQSRQFIKKFPFTPKTFYIDVIEKEITKNDWEFYIKDENQLKAVWKYYAKTQENETSF